MRRQDGRNLITTGDRLTETTRARQSGSRAGSFGRHDPLGLVAVADGAAQLGDVLQGGGVVDAGEEDLGVGGGPDGVGACFAVLVAQLPGGVDDGGDLDALAGGVGEAGGQVDGAQVKLVEGEQQPGVEFAVRLGQSVVAGGAVHVGSEAPEQRRARGAVPPGTSMEIVPRASVKAPASNGRGLRITRFGQVAPGSLRP